MQYYFPLQKEGFFHGSRIRTWVEHAHHGDEIVQRHESCKVSAPGDALVR